MDFEQYFKSETRSRSIHHFRDLFFLSEDESKAICAIINSSLFFCWFLAVCNGRNLTAVDVGRFPIGHFDKQILEKLSILFDELMESYKKNSVITKRSDCEYQEFRPGLSKDIIDKIDEIASHHYGLPEEEQDFIINYEIKYRLGKNLSSRVQRKS
jgi:hypothetical protein